MTQHVIPQGKVIGLSLSLCVSDIMRGDVKLEDVVLVKTMTAHPSRLSWDKGLESYGRTYWAQNPEEGFRIANALLDSGRIEQVRLYGGWHDIVDGHWLSAEASHEPELSEQGALCEVCGQPHALLQWDGSEWSCPACWKEPTRLS